MSRRTYRVRAATALAVAICLSAWHGAIAQATATPALFPSEPVGSSTSAQTVTVPFGNAGTLASIALAPAGTQDFQVLPGGTCAVGDNHGASDTCTVNVAFSPTAPGTTIAAVLLRNAAGATLGTLRVYGIGLGSAAAFTPGAVAQFALAGQSTHTFSALTTSSNGVAYFADSTTGQVLSLDPLTGNTSVIATVPTANNPVTAMSADVDGTLFLLGNSGTVVHVDPVTRALQAVAIPPGLGNNFTGIAVDPAGSLLLASSTAISRFDGSAWTTIAGSSTACNDPASTCGDGALATHATFSSIRAVAVDTKGNILIADNGTFRLRRIDTTTGLITTVAGTGTACAHAPCGDGGPAASASLGAVTGLAADPLGDVYLTEQGSGLRRIDAATATISSLLPAGVTGFRTGPVQLGTLRNGAVLLLDHANPMAIAQFSVGGAALTFAQTSVGQTSTDSVQTVTLSNLGNAPLTLATPSAGTNPSTTADFPFSTTQTCPQLSSSSAAQSLPPGATCSIEVKFTPTVVGTISSKVVIAEASAFAAAQGIAASPLINAATPTAHFITVQGIAASPSAQVSIALATLPNNPVYGQPVSTFATVYSSTNTGPTPTGTVSFYEGSTTLAANVALSGGTANNTVTIPTTGAHTYSVSYSGDSNYAASTQNATISVNVARAGSVFTVNLPTYQYGQNIRSAYVLSGQYSGTGIALPSGVVTYTLFDSSGNVVVTGNSNFAARVNSIDENAPLGALNAGNYTLSLSYPGDGNFLPLQQNYPLVVAQGSQTITFAPIASPVTYGTAPIGLSAIASSPLPSPGGPDGLPVSFSVLSGPGSISNGQLVVTGPGTIVVAADQPGNVNYAPAPEVTQTVISVRPVAKLVWNTPSPIYVGTPLGTNQLNAVALDPNGQPLPGTYTYTPVSGTVLPIGTATLSVSYVPSDTQHYSATPLTASVTLTVRDLVTPTVTFAGGAITYGGSLAPVLNATATANGSAVPGSFSYTVNSTPLTTATVLPVGTYSVAATFTPADSSTYRGGSATGTITVGKAATSVALTSSASPVLLNTSVTLTATVAGSGPTGTVQFANGSTMLGSAAVGSNGTASLTLSTLPAGSNNITATYGGDGNNNSGSAGFTQVVADFTLVLASGSSGSQIVLPGKVVTYQFTVAPAVTSTLVSDVSLTAAGLPSGATYTVTPSTVPGGSGSTTVTLTITAPATVRARVDRSPLHTPTSLVVAALLLLPFSSRLRRVSSRLRNAGLFALVLCASALLLTAMGCGSGVGYFDGGTPSTSTITLSANSGSLSHTAQVTLEVQ